MAVALIVPAGRGQRLGSDMPKALVAVAGRPMLYWSVRAAQAVSAISTIVVALPSDQLSQAPAGTIGVVGGASRSESVRLALQAAGEGDVVIVHDAARALVTAEMFAMAIVQFERSGADALVTAAPVTDTIKQVSVNGDMRVSSTLDRARLWAVQTPQVFHRPALEWALSASAEQLARATDDASLIEQGGGIVAVMPASADNFKITTPLDLRVAEMLLTGRRGR